MANSVDIMKLNILSSGLLDPIGTSRVKVYRPLYLTHTTIPAVSLLILCVGTLGKLNPILCPHFMPLLDVTVHLCSLERKRNRHGKPGIPSLKSMMFLFCFSQHQ